MLAETSVVLTILSALVGFLGLAAIMLIIVAFSNYRTYKTRQKLESIQKEHFNQPTQKTYIPLQSSFNFEDKEGSYYYGEQESTDLKEPVGKNSGKPTFHKPGM